MNELEAALKHCETQHAAKNLEIISLQQQQRDNTKRIRQMERQLAGITGDTPAV